MHGQNDQNTSLSIFFAKYDFSLLKHGFCLSIDHSPENTRLQSSQKFWTYYVTENCVGHHRRLIELLVVVPYHCSHGLSTTCLLLHQESHDPKQLINSLKGYLHIVKSKSLISMMHIITLQWIVILFLLHFRWSGGRLKYRATPHGDLVGYRSHIDHMESHEV